MIAQELEVSLHMAFVEARQKRHEFITVEHLLLAPGQSDGRGSAARLRRQHRGTEESARGLHRRAHPHGRGHRGNRYPADSRFPARDPACDPARPVLGQEGSDRRQCLGRDLRREGLSCRVFPAPAGRDAPRRGQLHLARHHEDACVEGSEGRRSRTGNRGRRAAVRRRSRNVYAQPQRPGAGGQDRSADRSRARDRACDPDAVPAAQEQSPSRGRGGRGQDSHRRRARAPYRRGPSSGDSGALPGIHARHGRAARGNQVPRRFRTAPEGGVEAAGGQPECDPVHR